MRNGLFLIPLIAAAQLSPRISAAIAFPTVVALLATAWITKSSNNEPWASILLTTTVLAGLAAGSVALSRIQRSKVEMIEQLAGQRTQLGLDLAFSSTHNTTAFSGGARYKPTTSLTLAISSGGWRI